LLPNYLSGEIRRERVFVREFPDYLRDDFRLVTSEKAITLDVERKSVESETDTIVYDKLIIATGSIPTFPNIKGIDKKGVFTFKSLGDADGVCGWEGHRAVIMGSGLIGVEVGLALRRRGYQVFLIELLDRVLPQVFDEYPASIIKGALEDGGIDVATGEKVVEILGESRVEEVASNKRRIKCDTVILATGMRPENGLVKGILKLGKFGGITVDDKMRTSIEDVYACGDCVEAQSLIDGRPQLSPLWHNARQQGQIAGTNATGIPQTYTGSLNITGVEVLGLKAASIGRIGASLDKDIEIIEVRKSERYRRLVLSKGVLVGIQSINWDENLGLFVAAILRKERVKTYKDLISSRYPPLKSLKEFHLTHKQALSCMQILE
jgi:NADH oxidase (H2O2-forming)